MEVSYFKITIIVLAHKYFDFLEAAMRNDVYLFGSLCSHNMFIIANRELCPLVQKLWVQVLTALLD